MRQTDAVMALRHEPDFEARTLLNKVPEITIAFWVIKVMSTTVGETAADFLNSNLGWGLTNTSLVMAALFLAALAWQFRSARYTPIIYWTTVVFISVVGTLITDNLTDGYGVPLWISTAVFSTALAVTFAVWYAVERTLSIHSIYTRRREAFYWLAILFTFSLGTAAGDGLSEGLALGYWTALLLFGAAIAVVTVAYYGFKINAVLAFWVAYILTRPLGASLGDLLTASKHNGGFGLSTTWISAAFFVVIIGLIWHMTRQERELREAADPVLARSERDEELQLHHHQVQIPGARRQEEPSGDSQPYA